MSVRQAGLLCAALFFIFLPLWEVSLAQSAGGGVVITSSPPGAVVELAGDYTLRGVTPWRLARGLAGTYTIRATKTGYRDWSGRTVLLSSRLDSIHVNLSRKTAARAALRSAIVPGWGQYDAEEPGKGTLFLLAEAAALSGVLWADGNRHDAEREHDQALEVYRSADQVDDIEDAYDDVLRTFDDLEKWHERRKRWIYAAAGIWLVAVLDAAFLSGSGGEGFAEGLSPEQGAGFFASVEADRTRAGFAFRF